MSNEKTNIEVTLLSKEEIEGKSKVLQIVGAGCGKSYWTSTTMSGYGYKWRYCVSGLIVDFSGAFYGWIDASSGYGVRPVLKSDNLEELIKNCKSEIKNGVQIIEYGEYPDLFEEVKINNQSFVKKTGKKYSLPPQDTFPAGCTLIEYNHNGKKVIEINKKYYPVKPVKFYVDRENSMLISTSVLFKSPINKDTKNYNGKFKASQLYSFLNYEFLKDLMPDEKAKYSHYDSNLIERIENLVRKNEELQAKSEAISRELEELKTSVQGRQYVKKIK